MKQHTKRLWILKLPKLWAENTFPCALSTLSFFITGISGFFINSEDIIPVMLWWAAVEILLFLETVQEDFFVNTLPSKLMVGKKFVSTPTFFLGTEDSVSVD